MCLRKRFWEGDFLILFPTSDRKKRVLSKPLSDLIIRAQNAVTEIAARPRYDGHGLAEHRRQRLRARVLPLLLLALLLLMHHPLAEVGGDLRGRLEAAAEISLPLTHTAAAATCCLSSPPLTPPRLARLPTSDMTTAPSLLASLLPPSLPLHRDCQKRLAAARRWRR